MDVVEAAAVGPALGDIGHLDRDVRRDHLAGVDQGRDGQRDRTGTAGELEHPVALSGRRRREKPFGDATAAFLDEVGVLGPSARD